MAMKTGGCIYQRGSTWWVKYYRNGKPFFESTRSDEKSAAKRLLAIRLGSVAKDEPLPPKHRAFMRELFDDVVVHYKNNELKSTPILLMKLDAHLLPAFGDYRGIDVTSADISRYVSKRKEAGAANATVNRELSTIKLAFRLGLEAGKIQRAPHFQMLEENNVREGFFEDSEYEAIRKRLPDHVKPITDIARITGLRKGELLSLTWGQVDFENGRINLRALDTKSKTARFFPMTTELWEILSRQRSETDSVQKRRSMIVTWVFHHNGERIKDFYAAWRTACRKAGYGGKLIHDFRRTAVRNFVRLGIPEKVAMLLSGHKTREVFERYNILSESDVLDAGKLLDGNSVGRLQNGYNRLISGKARK